MCGGGYGELLSPFLVKDGVRQLGFYSPFSVYNYGRSNVTIGVEAGGRRGLKWEIHYRLEVLDFADHICLLSQRQLDAISKIEEFYR